MERELTSHREREASSYLMQAFDYLIRHAATRRLTPDESAEINDLCEQFTHSCIEAAAERGRGQISS